MHPDVDWPNGMEGGRELGREAVRQYWTRQFTMIDSHVEPERLTPDDEGRITVDVHAVVRDLDGNVVSDAHIQHIYSFRDGLVSHMEIREP
jgi:SnoaL-like protein